VTTRDKCTSRMADRTRASARYEIEYTPDPSASARVIPYASIATRRGPLPLPDATCLDLALRHPATLITAFLEDMALCVG
jgi:hypothetical protein